MPGRNPRESSPTSSQGRAQRRRLEEALRDAQQSSPQQSSEQTTGTIATANGPSTAAGSTESPLQRYRQQPLETQRLMGQQPQIRLPQVQLDPSELPASYALSSNAGRGFVPRVSSQAVATAPSPAPAALLPTRERPQALRGRLARLSDVHPQASVHSLAATQNLPPGPQVSNPRAAAGTQNIPPVSPISSSGAAAAAADTVYRQNVRDTRPGASAGLLSLVRPSISPRHREGPGAEPSGSTRPSIRPLHQSEAAIEPSSAARSSPGPPRQPQTAPGSLRAARASASPLLSPRRDPGPSSAARSSQSPSHQSPAAPRSLGAAGTSTGPPRSPRRDPGPSSAAGSSKGESDTGTREVRLGIEAEFYLAARNPNHASDDLNDFVRVLAANWNAEVDIQNPRMLGSLKAPKEDDDYEKWAMVFEGSIVQSGSPWGIELRSPKLSVAPNSRWRKDVEDVWKYILANYELTTDEHCGTHIHISLVPNYNLTEIKRIASSIIYFEPAVEALVPGHRRGNKFAMSNYLASPYLERQGKSRRESIELIEMARDELEVFRFIQGYENKNFTWNFYNLVQGDKHTIEFRQPPASSTSAQTLSWAEFVINFIQASVKHGSLTILQTYPVNIRGLRSFLERDGVRDPQLNEPARLAKIWMARAGYTAIEPKPIPDSILSWKEHDKFTKEEEERMRVERLFEIYGGG